jgi:hypothetical protein
MADSRITRPARLAFLLALCAVGCATPTETAGGGGSDDDGEPPGLRDGYDATTVPHWRHLRMQMSDYRTQYLPDATARSVEYAWTAQHFDRIILDGGDSRSVPEYRRLMPDAELYRYVLTWTVVSPSAGWSPEPATSYYTHMQQWYAQHPQYRLEDAFLHDATQCGSTSRTESCRISLHIWTSDRWVTNPADPGLRAYNRERLTAIAADADGLFIDEHSSGDMIDRLQGRAIVEYPEWSAYERDVVQLLADIRAAVGKRLLLNTYNYATPWDVQMTTTAGGAHAEAFNNPLYAEMEKRWRHAEQVLAAGASLNILPQDVDLPGSYTAGNFDTPTSRRRIWDLASYYLVAPAQPGLFYLNSIGDKHGEPYATKWVGAVEANVGMPLAARRVVAEGTDAAGQRYRVWARDYERALVLVRAVIERGGTSYGEESAVDVALPSGERFRPLTIDGHVGPAIETLRLRAGEAAILIKEGRVAIDN